jgi:hypothetical protein
VEFIFSKGLNCMRGRTTEAAGSWEIPGRHVAHDPIMPGSGSFEDRRVVYPRAEMESRREIGMTNMAACLQLYKNYPVISTVLNFRHWRVV